MIQLYIDNQRIGAPMRLVEAGKWMKILKINFPNRSITWQIEKPL